MHYLQLDCIESEAQYHLINPIKLTLSEIIEFFFSIFNNQFHQPLFDQSDCLTHSSLKELLQTMPRWKLRTESLLV